MTRPSELLETRHNPEDFVEGDGTLVDVEAQPSRGDALLAVGFLHRDQGSQLKRFFEGDTAHLPHRRLGHGEVAALDRPFEDCSWVALGRQRRSPRGRTAARVYRCRIRVAW